MTDAPIVREMPTPPGPDRPTTLEADTLAYLTAMNEQLRPDINDVADWMADQTSLLSASFRLPLMITYTFDATTTVGDPGPGKIRINAGTTAILADAVDNLGQSATATLARLAAITGGTKGYVCLYKAGDPTARMVADVTAAAASGGGSGYYNLTITNVQSLGAALDNDDDVILTIQTAGNTGAQGNVGPSSNWAADSSYSPSGSPGLITFALPPGASSWRARFVGLTGPASRTLQVAISVNGGSSYGAASGLSSSIAAYNGTFSLEGLGRDFMKATAGISATAYPSAPDGTAYPDTTVVLNATGGATHIQFSLASAGTFNNVGTITTEKK